MFLFGAFNRMGCGVRRTLLKVFVIALGYFVSKGFFVFRGYVQGSCKILLLASLIFEGCHVDDEAVADVAFFHSCEGFVDVFDVDELDIGDDVVLCAEVEHLLCFGEATGTGAGDGFVSGEQGEWGYVVGFGGGADADVGSVCFEEWEVLIDVVCGRYGIEYEVE